MLEGDAMGFMNFNVHGPFSDTLLHIGVSYGNYEMCKALLKSGADVNRLNSNGESPFHIAETLGLSRRQTQQIHIVETLGIVKRWQHRACERNQFLDICDVLLKNEKKNQLDITYYYIAQ